MNNEKKENKNFLEHKESCSNEIEGSSSDHQNFILGLDEHPDIVIEKILIEIFNNIIANKNQKNNEKYIIDTQKKIIKKLCSKYESHDIILLLLTNIRNIIKKYRKIILEMPGIEELKENDLKRKFFRSYSINEKYSKIYINFGIDRFSENLSISPKKNKYLDYYMVIQNLFNKLKEIKICLKKAAPYIENLFEEFLS